MQHVEKLCFSSLCFVTLGSNLLIKKKLEDNGSLS